MKKLILCILAGIIISACTIAKVENMEADLSVAGKYDLVVNGYDWGPGVDRIIVHTDSAYPERKVKAEDFEVIVQTMVFNWGTMQWSTAAQYRKVAAVTVNGYDLVLEMPVAPDNPYSNPFIYTSKMMNEWQKVYNVRIKNEKLGIDVSELNKRICPQADLFTEKLSTTDDVTLRYAYWKPANEQKKPLLIWLHGMGEGGTDTQIALLGNKVVNLISEDVQKCFGTTGACVLVPQADGYWMQTEKKPEMKTWISETSGKTVSYFTKALFALIDNFVKENADIDRNRIYIGGCSNGGYMTVNMLLQYPDYFAAAYPICEAYPDSRIGEEELKVLAGQNIWFTQSKDDKTVFPEKYVLPTYDRLVKFGAKNVRLSLWDSVTDTTGLFKDEKGKPFKYNGHFSWIYVLNNECVENGQTIMEWLASKSL